MSSTENAPRRGPLLAQASGMAPHISQDSAATDNLASIMRNSVVVFESTLTIVQLSSPPHSREGTPDA
jgi:hypothetical protein